MHGIVRNQHIPSAIEQHDRLIHKANERLEEFGRGKLRPHAATGQEQLVCQIDRGGAHIERVFGQHAEGVVEVHGAEIHAPTIEVGRAYARIRLRYGAILLEALHTHGLFLIRHNGGIARSHDFL